MRKSPFSYKNYEGEGEEKAVLYGLFPETPFPHLSA
jgi:hypothetical protein